MSGTPEKIHFPGLNSLRFFAALAVLIGHVELTKSYLKLPDQYPLFERINFGGIGVYFFFVLSGFLITYLLCAEKEKENTVHIRDFYVRRVLRIWPLYYLIVILGFFVLPAFDFFSLAEASFKAEFASNLVLYLLMLPNLAFAIHTTPVHHIGQLWSIGVEEQFYLLWPLVVRHSRRILRMIFILFVAWLALKAAVVVAGKTGLINERLYLVLKKFLGMGKFECMMTGGAAAVLFFDKRTQLLRLIYHPVSQWLSLLLFPFASYLAGHNNLVQDVIHIPMSVMFAVIILNIATNPDSVVKLRSSMLDHLGKISYGIYMYHLIVIYVVLKVASGYLVPEGWLFNLLVYSLSVLLTCLISHLSYVFFEVYFINMKAKFTRIKSG